jgi:hypothetical protein
LPALDESGERKADRLTAAPTRVELFARLEVDTEVVHVHGSAGCCLVACSLFDVDHDEFRGLRTLVELDLGLRLS